jgi:hypothetical protein
MNWPSWLEWRPVPPEQELLIRTDELIECIQVEDESGLPTWGHDLVLADWVGALVRWAHSPEDRP